MKYSISEKEALEFCSIQADIFEASIDANKSEKDFIAKYMKSIYARNFDEGNYWVAFADKISIINEVSRIAKPSTKQRLNRQILRFIGYFYRYFCFKYQTTSVIAWKEVDFDYLYENYEVLHSYDIKKACEVVKDIIHVSRDTKHIQSLIQKH